MEESPWAWTAKPDPSTEHEQALAQGPLQPHWALGWEVGRGGGHEKDRIPFLSTCWGFGHGSLDPATEPGHCLRSPEEMKTPAGTWLSSGSEAGQPGLWTGDQAQTRQWPLLRLEVLKPVPTPHPISSEPLK